MSQPLAQQPEPEAARTDIKEEPARTDITEEPAAASAAVEGHEDEVLKLRDFVDCNWCTIEADPGVKGVQVVEIYFPDAAHLRALKYVVDPLWFRCLNERLILSDEHDNPPKDLFFANQIIVNACATQALISVVMNDTSGAVDLGSVLSLYKEFVDGIESYPVRGLCLSNMPTLAYAHNKFARPEYSQELESDTKPKVELDKPPSQKRRRKKKRRGSDYDENSATSDESEEEHDPNLFVPRRGETEQTEDDVDKYHGACHFLAYVPFRGAVWELDGLRRGPILTAAYDNESAETAQQSASEKAAPQLPLPPTTNSTQQRPQPTSPGDDDNTSLSSLSSSDVSPALSNYSSRSEPTTRSGGKPRGFAKARKAVPAKKLAVRRLSASSSDYASTQDGPDSRRGPVTTATSSSPAAPPVRTSARIRSRKAQKSAALHASEHGPDTTVVMMIDDSADDAEHDDGNQQTKEDLSTSVAVSKVTLDSADDAAKQNGLDHTSAPTFPEPTVPAQSPRAPIQTPVLDSPPLQVPAAQSIAELLRSMPGERIPTPASPLSSPPPATRTPSSAPPQSKVPARKKQPKAGATSTARPAPAPNQDQFDIMADAVMQRMQEYNVDHGYSLMAVVPDLLDVHSRPVEATLALRTRIMGDETLESCHDAIRAVEAAMGVSDQSLRKALTDVRQRKVLEANQALSLNSISSQLDAASSVNAPIVAATQGDPMNIDPSSQHDSGNDPKLPALDAEHAVQIYRSQLQLAQQSLTEINSQLELRSSWDVENLRRQHNYFPFILRFLELMAKRSPDALLEQIRQSERARF
ncbi:hypothetical protein RI367_003338 [Sorochytrium milnesiophthora]